MTTKIRASELPSNSSLALAGAGPRRLRRAASAQLALRLAAVVLLLGAWVLLVARLDQVPPGFQHDEMFSTRDALTVLGGHFPIYFPDNFGRGPLFMYTAAGVFALAGGHYVWSLHFCAALWALAGLATTFSLARRYLPWSLALLASGLMAGSFWFLMAGRLGVESIALLPLTTGMVYWLDRGLAQGARGERGSWRALVAAGVLGGAANYTYLASRTLYFLPAALLVLAGLAALWQRWRSGAPLAAALPELARPALVLGLMLAISSPLLIYLQRHPGTSDGRIGQLASAAGQALHGDIGPLFANAGETVKAVLWQGSYAIPYQYNLPGRPVMPPVLAVCLLLGLALTLIRIGRRREQVLLIALTLGLAPSALTGADALYMRGIYALPLLFILACRGLWGAGQAAAWGLRRLGVQGRAGLNAGLRAAAGLALVALFVWHTADGAQAYFVTWASAEPAQRIYNADFRAAAAWLDTQPGDEPIYIGTDRILDLDSETFRYYQPARNNVNWFNLPDTPPLPAAGSALYLLPAGAAGGTLPGVLPLFSGVITGQITLPMPGQGYDLMHGFWLNAPDVDAVLRAQAVQPLTQTVAYGGALQLAGLGLKDQGQQATVTSVWNALAAWPRQARPGYPPARPKISLALADAAGYKWAQTDETTSLPFMTWQPGERLVLTTTLALPADLPPGSYELRLGLYDDEQGPLPATVQGEAASSAPAVRVATLGVRPAATPPSPPAAVNPVAVPAAGPALAPIGAWDMPASLETGLATDLHLTWVTAQALATAGLHFELDAQTAAGQPLWQQPVDPAQPLPAQWPAGQALRLTHRLLPQNPQPGKVDAVMRICATQNGATLGCAQLDPLPLVTRRVAMTFPQPPQHALNAAWGDHLTLLGYDLSQSGATLSLTLYWRGGAAPVGPLKRFVHAVALAGTGDSILAQQDIELQSDGADTGQWRPGESVLDHVTLTLPAGKQPGTLYIGLYDPNSGLRLALQPGPGAAASDDRLVITLAR